MGPHAQYGERPWIGFGSLLLLFIIIALPSGPAALEEINTTSGKWNIKQTLTERVLKTLLISPLLHSSNIFSKHVNKKGGPFQERFWFVMWAGRFVGERVVYCRPGKCYTLVVVSEVLPPLRTTLGVLKSIECNMLLLYLCAIPHERCQASRGSSTVSAEPLEAGKKKSRMQSKNRAILFLCQHFFS